MLPITITELTTEKISHFPIIPLSKFTRSENTYNKSYTKNLNPWFYSPLLLTHLGSCPQGRWSFIWSGVLAGKRGVGGVVVYSLVHRQAISLLSSLLYQPHGVRRCVCLQGLCSCCVLGLFLAIVWWGK